MNPVRTRPYSKILTAWGETKPIKVWAADPRCLVQRHDLSDRIHRGLHAERAISIQPGTLRASRIISSGLSGDRAHTARQKELLNQWITYERGSLLWGVTVSSDVKLWRVRVKTTMPKRPYRWAYLKGHFWSEVEAGWNRDCLALAFRENAKLNTHRDFWPNLVRRYGQWQYLLSPTVEDSQKLMENNPRIIAQLKSLDCKLVWES